jgi:hypothetical protein
MTEPTIQEEVEFIFKWSGWEYRKPKPDEIEFIFDEEMKWWFAPGGLNEDGECITLYSLPTPDDIEFLGYMDKYVEPHIKSLGFRIYYQQRAKDWIANVMWLDDTGLKIRQRVTNVKYEYKNESKAVAALNMAYAIYEVIKER